MEENVGVQVLVTANNASEHLNESLNSILPAVQDRPWVFIFHDDGSNDNTIDIAYSFAKRCNAASVVLERSHKSETIGIAKNKTFNLINPFRNKYPWVCVHDSDDLMYDTRINGLIGVAESTGCDFVYGSYNITSPKLNGRVSAQRQNELLGFGIWATIIHESLIPESGAFFRTDMSVFEDHAKWWDMRYVDGIDMIPAEDVMTTNYIKRGASVTLKPTRDQIEKLKSVRNKVYKHPLTH